jgi:hypothetical protein
MAYDGFSGDAATANRLGDTRMSDYDRRLAQHYVGQGMALAEWVVRALDRVRTLVGPRQEAGSAAGVARPRAVRGTRAP